ncbi:hypothetical protein ACAG39_09145 [Caldicellulosiruptoraceae bacterium PP1]
MYKLEINIAAYDKADILNYLQEIYEEIRYNNKIFINYTDDLSNEYVNATIYNIKDEYDDEKYCEQMAKAQPIFDDLEKDMHYYFLTKIAGFSEEEARKECDEIF